MYSDQEINVKTLRWDQGVVAYHWNPVSDSIRLHDNIILYLRDVSFLLLQRDETSLQQL